MQPGGDVGALAKREERAVSAEAWGLPSRRRAHAEALSHRSHGGVQVRDGIDQVVVMRPDRSPPSSRPAASDGARR